MKATGRAGPALRQSPWLERPCTLSLRSSRTIRTACAANDAIKQQNASTGHEAARAFLAKDDENPANAEQTIDVVLDDRHGIFVAIFLIRFETRRVRPPPLKVEVPK